MVWVAYVSVQSSTTELKVAGNLRQGMLLRQAAEGALDRVTNLCDINPEVFADKTFEITKNSVVGTPEILLDCDASLGTCTLHSAFKTGRAEFQSFSNVFGPFSDPHHRDQYSYTVALHSHGPPQKMPRTEKFCMAKYDLVVETHAPIGNESFQARSTIAAQPVRCGSH